MNNKRTTGFTLIELLISVSLTLLLSIICIDWVASSYSQVMRFCSNSGYAISICAAQDQLVRDLYSMNGEHQWSDIKPYIWNRDNDSVGWELVEGKLIRMEGEYNYSAGVWEQGTKNIIADGIESFELVRDSLQGNARVTCTLVSKISPQHYVRHATMRNRAV